MDADPLTWRAAGLFDARGPRMEGRRWREAHMPFASTLVSPPALADSFPEIESAERDCHRASQEPP